MESEVYRLPETRPPWLTEEMVDCLKGGYSFKFTEAEREVFRRPPKDNPKPPPDAKG